MAYTYVIRIQRSSCVFRTQLETLVNFLQPHLQRHMLCILVNTHQVANDRFNCKGNSLTFETMRKSDFCYYSIFLRVCGMELLRRLKRSPGLLGQMPALSFRLAVENPRVHLGISWFGMLIRSLPLSCF